VEEKPIDDYEGTIKQAAAGAEAQQWINAILNDTDPCVLPEQACVVSEILEAIYKSAETGEPVYFD
jgi:predicted dehydrogenase